MAKRKADALTTVAAIATFDPDGELLTKWCSSCPDGGAFHTPMNFTLAKTKSSDSVPVAKYVH